MRHFAGSIYLLILIGTFTEASAELPPKVLADKYLMEAEQLVEIKHYNDALKLLDRIIALQREHGFDLRDEFNFKRAKIAFAAGLVPMAIESVTAYLSTGNEGAFYKEALALLIKAEKEMQKMHEVEITPDNTCAGKLEGGSCWMALADRPECYVWNPNPQKDESVTWSGACLGNVARGEGTLTWAVADADSIKISQTSTGRLRNGKFHGDWISHDADGDVSEGTFADGVRHGTFVWRKIYQDRMIQGSKGKYVHGKSEGRWLYYDPEWKTCSSRIFRQGEAISEQQEVNLENCQRETW